MKKNALVAEPITKGIVRVKPVANCDRFGKVAKLSADVSPIDDGGIRDCILTVRGVQVMLDRDLATLYGVDVKPKFVSWALF